MAELRQLLSMCGQSPGGRIVSSQELSEIQIGDAQLHNRFYVDPDGFGFAFVPWNLTTTKDRKREADYFSRNGMMV